MTVHCPNCGGPVEAPVHVEAVTHSRHGKQVEVFFTAITVEHDCEAK